MMEDPRLGSLEMSYGPIENSSKNLIENSREARGLPKPAALKDRPIVAPQDRRPHRAQRPEPSEARGYYRPFDLLGQTPKSQLMADHFAF